MAAGELLDPYFLLIYAGALGQLVVGAIVWAVGRREWRMRMFAILLSANAFWDVADFVGLSVSPGRVQAALLNLRLLLAPVATAAAIGFAVTYPTRLRWARKPAAPWGILGIGGVVAVSAFLTLRSTGDTLTPVEQTTTIAFDILALAWFPALTWAALRALRRAHEDRSARFIALGALVYPFFALGQFVVEPAWPATSDAAQLSAYWTWADRLHWVLNLLVIAAIVAVYGRVARLSQGVERMLVVLFMAASSFYSIIAARIGAGLSAGWFDFPSAGLGFFAMAFAGLNGYALLRYKMFDIDLKVKFGLRQSTVASILIATFFVVSELTAQLVGDTAAGPTLGILAAGGLVFAMAPLQRFAEGVADRAMPNVHDTEWFLQNRKLEVYRATVRSAFEDGSLTRAERFMLATLQDELGISARDALAAEQDAEPRLRR